MAIKIKLSMARTISNKLKVIKLKISSEENKNSIK
jgi:hypothetical protein